MLDRINKLFLKPKPKLSDEARDFITKLAISDIWLLAIGVRGTPVLPVLTDPDFLPTALKTVAAYRMELSELGDDEMNSGPLSLRTKVGTPRVANSGLSAAITAWLVKDTPTVTESHSRVTPIKP